MASRANIVCLIALGSLASAFGQTETTRSDPGQTAQKFIGEKLALWKQRLKLDD